MYLPGHFEQPQPEALHALMLDHPLATVVTLSAGGINANHVPLLWSAEPDPFGTLRGHVARANPMWSDRVSDVEALAIFQGVDGYISPSWYPTKREHGKVVPTWNYAVVHAYGTLRVIQDAAWLRDLLEALVSRHEASTSAPWSMADAPQEYIERMIGSIVGFEIVISRLIGKWKVSQNQPAENRAGVVDALLRRGDAEAIRMAALVEAASK